MIPRTDWLAWRAALSPESPALEEDGEVLDFLALERAASAAASALHACGVREGDVVASLVGNGLPFVRLLHAVDRCGATLLPLNTRLGPREIGFQLDDAGAGWLVHAGGDLASLATEAAADRARLRRLSVDALPEADPRARPDAAIAERDPDRTLAILYTSGTTGHPRGVRLSAANFFWNAVGSALHLGVHPQDRWLACMPLFHVGGLAILFRSLLYGTTVVIHERFDAEAVSRALDEERITLVSMVSTMLQRVLDVRGGRPAPAGLRCVLLGGGPTPEPLLERAERVGFRVAPTYGLTEATSQVATRPPAETRRPLDGAGRPLFGTQVRIADAAGRTLPPGREGEILVRGPTVMQGYVRAEGSATSGLRGGWLHTGDIGVLDAEGWLRVLDRRSDLIVSGGENVYPAEVEAALLQHPQVREAGVIGEPDAEYGQRVVAFVVPREAARLDTASLRQFCRPRLAGFKIPREVRCVESLPRTGAGKLVRARLRASALQGARKTGPC